ncbi:MAG: family 10 glycosylhydrolase [Planctomycetota bacterium]|nr:family 10 glycosylhydrolase [Planctomycetota bacterium]
MLRPWMTGQFSLAFLSMVFALSTASAQSGPIVPRPSPPSNGSLRVRTTPPPSATSGVTQAGLKSSRLDNSSINTRLRIAWGGGKPVQWSGTIEVSEGHFQQLVNHGVELSPTSFLSSHHPSDRFSTLHNQISVSQPTAQEYDALDVSLTTSRNARLKINLVAVDDPQLTFRIDRPIEQFLFKSLNMELDEQGNRGQVRRAPGDILRVQHRRTTMVFNPNEVFELSLIPHLLGRERNGVYQYSALVIAKDQEQIIHQQQHQVEVTEPDQFPVWNNLQIPIPSRPGVYDIAFRVDSKRFTDNIVRPAPLATRSIQFVVVGGIKAPSSNQAKWKEIVKFNPADPAWWEQLASLNPTDQLKYLTGSSPSDLGFKPFGNGQVQKIEHFGKPYSKLTDGGWQAYPLTIEHLNRPHLLEVEYPSDVFQTMGISILEPNALGKIVPLGIDSGFYLHRPEWSQSDVSLKHKILFWPKTKHPMLVLRNQFGTLDAVFGHIKVSELQGNISDLYPTNPNFARDKYDVTNTRQTLTYFNKPLFVENFGATEARTKDNSTTLDDWNTFFQGGVRLADYLQFSGNSGAILNVLSDGSSLFPSAHFNSLPKYDSGAFFFNGQDPVKKDVLEMLLRIFDKKELTLVPALQLSGRLHELESIGKHDQSIYLQYDHNSALTSENKPLYNPLDPRVQTAIHNLITSLVTRYQMHPSFGGICLELTPDTYTQLPSAHWTPDAKTLARFFAEKQLAPSSSHEENILAIKQRYRREWTDWVSQELMNFYVRLAKDFKQRFPTNSNARIYISTGELYTTPRARRLAHPTIPARNTLVGLLSELGLDPAATKTLDHIVWLQPHHANPVLDPVSQHVQMELNRSLSLGKLFSQQKTTGVLFQHSPHVAKLEDLERQSPWGTQNTNTWFANTLTPSHQFNRQRFISAWATSDQQIFVDGGWMLSMGQEDSTRQLFYSYRQLPDVKFETVRPSGTPIDQPLVIRRHLATNANQQSTYLYVLNNAPWATTAQVELLLSPNGHPVALGQEAKSSFRWHPKGATWQLVMEPFDLIAVRIDHAEAVVVGANVQYNQEVVPQLQNSLLKVNQRLGPLQQPSSRTPLKNAGFEAPSGNQAIPGWVYNSQTGNRVEVVQNSAQSGQQSIALHRPPTSQQVLWIRSEPFNVPPTGRLAFTAWMRTSTPDRQPSIRLSIEGRLEGKNYYRPRTIGKPESGITTTRNLNPLTSEWNRYVLIVNDLPTQGLTDLRVGFDLMSPGNVEIDNLQVYDLWFQEREYRELMKDISIAYAQPVQGRVSDCYEYLSSYWPRYLTKYAPDKQATIAQQTTLTDRENTGGPTKPTPVWPKLPNVLEQFKEIPTKLFPF